MSDYAYSTCYQGPGRLKECTLSGELATVISLPFLFYNPITVSPWSPLSRSRLLPGEQNMSVDIYSNLRQTSGCSSPVKSPPPSTSPRNNSNFLAAEKESPSLGVTEHNIPISHEETSESDSHSLSDRLAWLSFSFWTRLHTIIERWVIATSRRLHQSWWAILSEFMARPDSHRSIASQRRGSHQPSPCPDWCVSLADDVPIHVGQGYQSSGDFADSGIGSPSPNGTFKPEMDSPSHASHC